MNKNFLNQANRFMDDLPYKKSPFNGRNWGHAWHSLCSYHGKLKPAIAHFLISYFTKPGDIVLDPLCGVGTIPFEASLQGRIGIGNDLSELAFCVSKAKLERPSLDKVQTAIKDLENYIIARLPQLSFDATQYRDFGLNHTLKEYFHPDTYREIIIAREYFHNRRNNLSPEDAIVFSCLLHVLHGNRPYALSRTSHPLTPYAPTGEYTYKNAIKHIDNKIKLAYKCNSFDEYCNGQAIYGDFNDLEGINADAIITSPPFADSFKFYSQNWMRLWLCGWEPDDFRTANDKFLDDKQNTNFDIYYSFFEMCYRNLKPNGIVILHLGKTAKFDMAQELSLRAKKLFNIVYIGTENVENIEKHGIKDKGGTLAHQFLFLQKK